MRVHHYSNQSTTRQRRTVRVVSTMNFLLALVVCACFKFSLCEITKGYYTIIGRNESVEPQPYLCPYSSAKATSVGISGVDYVLSQRQDYGWGDQTHRAVIILALNEDEVRTKTTEDEMKLMKHQLDVELSIALLRNSSTEVFTINDLALYVSALISVNRNPRDFHGRDLVAMLERHTASEPNVHPYIVLTLCNARAVTLDHLKLIAKYIDEENHFDRSFMELKALAVKAFFCSQKDMDISSVRVDLNKAVRCLEELQRKEDGSFGNLYTTSLVTQALTASDSEDWKEEAAIQYLLSQRTVDVSIISTYYIEMALASRRIPFLKRLSKKQEPTMNELELLLSLPKSFFIQYSVRIGDFPDIFNSITLKIPKNITFYQTMMIIAHENDNFRFLDYKNKDGHREIYSMSGVPNDGERSLYWQLYRHQGKLQDIRVSPSEFSPGTNDVFIWWYRKAFQKRDNS